jgi:hypothetical protein
MLLLILLLLLLLLLLLQLCRRTPPPTFHFVKDFKHHASCITKRASAAAAVAAAAVQADPPNLSFRKRVQASNGKCVTMQTWGQISHNSTNGYPSELKPLASNKFFYCAKRQRRQVARQHCDLAQVVHGRQPKRPGVVRLQEELQQACEF